MGVFTSTDCASSDAPIPTIRSSLHSRVIPAGYAPRRRGGFSCWRGTDGRGGDSRYSHGHRTPSSRRRGRLLSMRRRAVPLNAEELAGIAARFKIPGILEILAAIEKIRHLVFPWCHRGNTHMAWKVRTDSNSGSREMFGCLSGVSSRGEHRPDHMPLCETARTITSRV
jgi:hypothetical protein